jgi:hypothetical protein
MQRRRLIHRTLLETNEMAFVSTALFAIICFVVVFTSGSKPDIRTHLVSHGAAAWKSVRCKAWSWELP